MFYYGVCSHTFHMEEHLTGVLLFRDVSVDSETVFSLVFTCGVGGGSVK